MAIGNDDVARLEQAEVIGGNGERLGRVDGVYFDNATDRPDWVAVRSGLFGLDVSLVPLAAAELRGDELHVPVDKDQMKSAPHHPPGRELTPQDEIELFRHYGVSYEAWAATASSPAGNTAGPVDPDRGTDTAMTRSEEQLRVHTQSQPVGRVRLRKHIVTEYRQITVPVRREEIRLEREPFDEAGTSMAAGTVAGGAGPAGGSAAAAANLGTGDPDDAEQEIILYAERPVVRTETVAVERIRLGKQTVTEHETVGGEVRREEIEVDTDPHTPDVR